MIDLVAKKARLASTLPGSTGLFSPRWSPDGRYLAALSVEGSKKLMLYDFRTHKWSEWLTEANNVSYPSWSADSRYIYYDNLATDNPKCRRVKLGENHPAQLFSPNSLRRSLGPWRTWGRTGPHAS